MSNYSIKVLTPLNHIQYNFILVIINDQLSMASWKKN